MKYQIVRKKKSQRLLIGMETGLLAATVLTKATPVFCVLALSYFATHVGLFLVR